MPDSTRPTAPQPQRQAVKSVHSSQAKYPAGKKSKGKGLSAGSMISITLVLIIIAVFAVVYFDIGGSKAVAASVLSLDDPTAEQLAELEKRKKELDAIEAAYAETRKDLDKAAIDNEKTAAELEAKAAELAAKEAELAALEEKLTGQKADLDATIAMFEKMSPDKAAKAIGKMKYVRDMVTLLSNMSSEKAALILDNMDQAIATKIATQLVADLKNGD